MTPEDRRNLAIELSAFANADGGLIVWGVRTREERAVELKPIAPLSQFFTDLTRYAADGIRPSLDGVRHKKIKIAGSDSGYAVTYVPATEGDPCMAKNRENRYYRRSGSQSLPMEHFEIADMFGRRRRPQMELHYQVSSGSVTSSHRGKFRGVVVTLHVSNSGRASAAAPYLNVQVTEPFGIYPSGISAPPIPPSTSQPLMPPSHETGTRARCFVARADFVIHPRVSYLVARITGQIPESDPKFHDLSVIYSIAAENCPLESYELRIPADELVAAVRR